MRGCHLHCGASGSVAGHQQTEREQDHQADQAEWEQDRAPPESLQAARQLLGARDYLVSRQPGELRELLAETRIISL
jgi:hypothetical protein